MPPLIEQKNKKNETDDIQGNDNATDETITQAKWIKTKTDSKDLRKAIGTRDHSGTMQHKKLELIVGNLNDIAIAYEINVPFLRRFHNTTDSL